MRQIATINPPNSIVFIEDVAGGQAPAWMDDVMILSSSSCIVVRCFPEQDGPTEVVLGGCAEVDPGDPPTFEGDLETPSRRLNIRSVDRKAILANSVSDIHTRVRIWLSHPQWPDKVIIGLI
jgi:hypothetical protein